MGRTILIIVIVIVLIAGAGLGAYAMGDKAGFQRANAVRQQFFQSRQTTSGQSQQGSGTGAGNFAGASGGAGRATLGTIKSVNGNALVVTLGTRDVNVTIDGSTKVERTLPTATSDLKAGMQVLVTGQQGSGGGLAATTILIMPTQ